MRLRNRLYVSGLVIVGATASQASLALAAPPAAVAAPPAPKAAVAAPAAPALPPAPPPPATPVAAAPAAPPVAAPVAAPPPPAPEPTPASAPAPVAAAAPPAAPAPEAKADDLPAIHVGVGLRAGLEEAHQKTDLSTLDVRPYISGQVNKYVKFQTNLDSNDPQGAANLQLIRVLDAVAQFELDPLFNVWVGRFLPPSDRPNLSGPYYQNSWVFPATSRYPAIYAGRDNGAAVWGQVDGGRFKYQVGAFNGGVADSLDAWRYAGRLTLNLLDPEPGYYNSSTYYGQKDILAIGGVAQIQQDHTYAPGDRATFFAASADVLFEKNLHEAGVLTLEGEYYNFEGARLGSSVMATGSYLIPTTVGVGRFQPVIRWQNYMQDNDVGNPTENIFDAGVNYIIDGHNLRLALNWEHDGLSSGGSADAVQLGVQVQK